MVLSNFLVLILWSNILFVSSKAKKGIIESLQVPANPQTMADFKKIGKIFSLLESLNYSNIKVFIAVSPNLAKEAVRYDFPNPLKNPYNPQFL